MAASFTRKLVIRGGRIIDPDSGFDAPGSVLIENGRITSVDQGTVVSPSDAEVIEASGQIVSPGFVDLHAHLRFPGFPERETMKSGTAAAAAGGFTTICAMANTKPVIDNAKELREVLNEARRKACVHVHQLGAVTRRLEGTELTDMQSLADAGAVAFSDDGKPVWNQEIMARALSTAGELSKAISVHEEDPEIVADGVANAGPIARRLGLPEWPCSGEASMVARDIGLLERSGGYLHIAHVSCADTLPLIRDAKARGLSVTAEATPHHLTLDDSLLEGDAEISLSAANTLTKVNPPLRSSQDVGAVQEALRDGTIDAIATDHAPHAEADKQPPYATAAFGFTAFETALPLLLDLVVKRRIELATLIQRLTVGPSKVFGLNAGTLRPGSPADVCIFDPEAVWSIEPTALRSTGKNTPLLGKRVRGRVTCILVAGKIVHRPK
jgi:dihydroorotase